MAKEVKQPKIKVSKLTLAIGHGQDHSKGNVKRDSTNRGKGK